MNIYFVLSVIVVTGLDAWLYAKARRAVTYKLPRWTTMVPGTGFYFYWKHCR